MSPTRRQVIVGTGAGIAGFGGVPTAPGAQEDAPEITFGEMNKEREWLILHNEENQVVDIKGWYLDWEARNENRDQWDAFQEKYGTTTIKAENAIKVATGYKDVDDADVTFENNAGRMNNNADDVYAVYRPDQDTEVANSKDDLHQEDTPTETESPTPTETTSPTATATESPTSTPTPIETPTNTPTPTPTEDGLVIRVGTESPTPTSSPTPTVMETAKFTPTETATPTITGTVSQTDYRSGSTMTETATLTETLNTTGLTPTATVGGGPGLGIIGTLGGLASVSVYYLYKSDN